MQSTIISRTRASVTAAEPEPQHDRPTTTSTPTPAPHPHAAQTTLTPDQLLGRELLHRVHTADARIPQERRAPRTLQDMQARIARAQGPCPVCGGTGGWSETTTTADGAQITIWHPCHAC